MKKGILLLFITCIACIGMAQDESAAPKNVIIIVGDGMGFHHVNASSYYQFGKAKGQEYWSFFPLAMATYSLNNEEGYDPEKAAQHFNYVKENPTDSAAAATALSTGHKTKNGILGQTEDEEELPHIMLDAEAMGKATGVLSTVHFAHATPAGFVAHNESRNNYQEISEDMIWHSKVDVIIGAGHPWYNDNGEQVGGVQPTIYETPLSYKRVGGLESWKNLLKGIPAQDADGDNQPDAWKLITSREEFQSIVKGDPPKRLLGVPQVYSTLQANREGEEKQLPFEQPLLQSSPTMKEMMAAALHTLSADEDGFVLMAEGGAIDWASHANHSGRMLEEHIAFDEAVAYTIQWIEENSNWDETLLIVTSDHECGYLTGHGSDPELEPIQNNGKETLPGMKWQSGGHTNQLVPFFVKGTGAGEFANHVQDVDPRYGPYIDNTAIAKVVRKIWNRP
jgi:alkaline phosphatase